jgi:hypothetical protein
MYSRVPRSHPERIEHLNSSLNRIAWLVDHRKRDMWFAIRLGRPPPQSRGAFDHAPRLPLPGEMEINGIAHVQLTVNDFEACKAFWRLARDCVVRSRRAPPHHRPSPSTRVPVVAPGAPALRPGWPDRAARAANAATRSCCRQRPSVTSRRRSGCSSTSLLFAANRVSKAPRITIARPRAGQWSSSIGDGVAIHACLSTEDLGVLDSAFDALHK